MRAIFRFAALLIPIDFLSKRSKMPFGCVLMSSLAATAAVPTRAFTDFIANFRPPVEASFLATASFRITIRRFDRRPALLLATTLATGFVDMRTGDDGGVSANNSSSSNSSSESSLDGGARFSTGLTTAVAVVVFVSG